MTTRDAARPTLPEAGERDEQVGEMVRTHDESPRSKRAKRRRDRQIFVAPAPAAPVGEPRTSRELVSIDPANEEILARYPEASPRELEDRLATSVRAFRRWSVQPLAERAAALREAGEILDADVNAAAERISTEMGKPFREARDEVRKTARLLLWCGDEQATAALEGSLIGEGTRLAYEPLGPILGIMPWNFPYWQPMRFAAPALLAGNTILLKPASNVTASSLALEAALREAGLRDIYQTLLLRSDRIPHVIADPAVRGVAFTGGERAGAAVASAAGAAFKPLSLELGGSDAFIVLDDADPTETAKVASAARLANTGQSCIAPKRFIVAERVYDEFLERFVETMRAPRLGDGMHYATQLGPLATASGLDRIAEQVESSVEAGARVETGGDVLERPGFFYRPTVLTAVTPEMPVAREETFGPVAPVFQFGDDHEAIELANATRYGLGASVWTADPERGARVASKVQAGMVFVNEVVASDPTRPFGGVKGSGHGRELGAEGVRAFTNRKVYVARG